MPPRSRPTSKRGSIRRGSSGRGRKVPNTCGWLTKLANSFINNKSSSDIVPTEAISKLETK
jgi:hypothetical protein